MNMRAKVFIAILLPLLMLSFFWFNGSIPELVARAASKKYVSANYGDMGFVFDKTDILQVTVAINFIDKDGNKYAFMLPPGKFWPAQAWYIYPTGP